ncbi:hypothetical protein ASG43_06845 [Aureimonas sp. Leaf454]|uniref:nitrilase-related carbon-nitrogen hydrolase n=1 Tax=Aureimonas sp. Leaf454 TaxID=1736381 RepID=UPI0006FE7810|nr:nitrilase-related carbon-nitrogen hydrolase [Aureimonas sp. Leaf454]KQT50959.1 hypothetical protein ASG43_06845 [Aureimonas sp. Leaf454]
MQIRACQIAADIGSPTARRSAIRWLVADAAMDGADVVVFPELALTGYGAGETIASEAEPAEGAALADLRALADAHRITIVTGLALAEESGVSNAAVAVQPGRPPVVYAKRHLYGAYEKALFVPGTTPSPLFEVAGMKAGLLVCFDVEFPERVRELAEAGAEIIFVPTALPRSAGARFIAEHVVPVRAFENQVFIVYVDHCGEDARFAYQGLSCIAAPDGSRLASAPADAAAMLSVTVDGGDYEAARRENPYLQELADSRLR